MTNRQFEQSDRPDIDRVTAILAAADGRAETLAETTVRLSDGVVVDSVKRSHDYMAFVNGNRAAWGCGKTRESAIEDAVRTFVSLRPNNTR